MKFRSDQSNDISRAILNKQSFVIYNVSDMTKLVESLEHFIESNDMSCRIYTRNRAVAAGVGLFSLGAGIATLAGIAAHNLATYNPDWELGKDFGGNQLYVTYKK